MKQPKDIARSAERRTVPFSGYDRPGGAITVCLLSQIADRRKKRKELVLVVYISVVDWPLSLLSPSINLVTVVEDIRSEMTTSISGYTASDSAQGIGPRFYQSKCVNKSQSRPSTSRHDSITPQTAFATYAKAHACPNESVKPSNFAVPEPTRVMSSEPSISPRTSILSPALQAAAAQALPMFALYENKMPPMAETRPSTAVAASHQLPGLQQIIEATASRTIGHGSGNNLAFGSTTKIVPLPVATTRPLPLVERQKRAKPPVVLTASEYSLRSSAGQYQEPSYIAPARWSNVNPRYAQAYGTASASYVADYTFPPRGPQSYKTNVNNDHLGPFDIPPGFTSVNPPGRSFIAKKKHGSQEGRRKTTKTNVQPVRPIFPPGFNGVTLSSEESPEPYREGEVQLAYNEPATQNAPASSNRTSQQKRKDGESRYDASPFRLIDLQNSVVNVKDGPQLGKRPRGRPPGVDSKKRKNTEVESSFHDMSEDGSETTADGSEATLREVSLDPVNIIWFRLMQAYLEGQRWQHPRTTCNLFIESSAPSVS